VLRGPELLGARAGHPDATSTWACSRSSPSNTIPGFNRALIELIPSLEDHACSLGRRGGFISRLRGRHVAGPRRRACRAGAAEPGRHGRRHGKTRGTGEYGRYNVIYEFREEQVGIEAGRIAVALVNHLVAPVDPAARLRPRSSRASSGIAERRAFGPSTQAISSTRRCQPRHPVHPPRPVSLVQLGQGVHQQRIRATMTSRTSASRSTSRRTRA
jgi:cyanophycin synthetase